MLENDKTDIENEIKNKEIKARERIIPEIERITKQIQEMNSEIASSQIRIEKEEGQNNDLETKLMAMEKDKEEYKDKIEAL